MPDGVDGAAEGVKLAAILGLVLAARRDAEPALQTETTNAEIPVIRETAT